MTQIKLEFEVIDDHHQRAKVIGGWLVKAYEDVTHVLPGQGLQSGWDWRVAMAFVPDPNHEWTIDEEMKDED